MKNNKNKEVNRLIVAVIFYTVLFCGCTNEKIYRIKTIEYNTHNNTFIPDYYDGRTIERYDEYERLIEVSGYTNSDDQTEILAWINIEYKSDSGTRIDYIKRKLWAYDTIDIFNNGKNDLIYSLDYGKNAEEVQKYLLNKNNKVTQFIHTGGHNRREKLGFFYYYLFDSNGLLTASVYLDLFTDIDLEYRIKKEYYSDYKFDQHGNWISRKKTEMIIILSKEEYYNLSMDEVNNYKKFLTQPVKSAKKEVQKRDITYY